MIRKVNSRLTESREIDNLRESAGCVSSCRDHYGSGRYRILVPASSLSGDAVLLLLKAGS